MVRPVSDAQNTAQVVPAPHVSVTPITVTQKTAPAVLGITRKKFLELIVRWSIPHACDGQARIVRLDAWLAALAQHEVVRPANDAPVTDEESARLSLLAELGRKPKRGTGRR